ncbi:MAG: transcriptional regulator [Cupriavidus sp.]|nr:transcriptional regulator [Cupriavidus sp.]
MMSAPQIPVSEADLHAYADGYLQGPRRAQVEAFLAADPEAAQRIEAWRRQAAALHAGLDGVLNEAVPLAALPRQLHDGPAAPTLRPSWSLALAASLSTLFVGGAGGWYAHDRLGSTTVATLPMERFAREALASHVVFAPEVRHAVEVPASDEAHLIAWLSKRLGARLPVPDLGAQGFRLIGGRLGASEGGPMAILMYESDDGTRLSLQLTRMAQGTPDTAFRLERMPPSVARQPAGRAAMAFYWVDRDLGFALAGPLERDRLLALAQTVYQQSQRS